MTGNVSLNENGDRQQGYKIEQIETTPDFRLRVTMPFIIKAQFFQMWLTNLVLTMC